MQCSENSDEYYDEVNKRSLQDQIIQERNPDEEESQMSTSMIESEITGDCDTRIDNDARAVTLERTHNKPELRFSS